MTHSDIDEACRPVAAHAICQVGLQHRAGQKYRTPSFHSYGVNNQRRI